MVADHDDVATLVASYNRAVAAGFVKKGAYVGTGKASWMSAVMSDTGWGRTKTARVMTMAQLSGHIVDGKISPSAALATVNSMPSYTAPTDWQGDESVAEFPDLPSDEPAYEELKARQIEDFKRLNANREAAKLIKVKVKIDGPFGIMAMGDPHVDAHGTDWPLLDRHTQIIKRTEGLFGANVGDITNNWVGRLARLYGEQNMGRKRALILAEGWLREVRWLWIDPGNHDLWSGADDPVRWITRFAGVHYKWQGTRLELVPPNGASVIVNSRHDHPGYSMYHPTHGPL
ncbi:MAG: hypothetical protein KGL35_11755, partial [Bradyrhizobium sp.]|nr:hypothetical protein [Bradyrhizobium sp.]